MAELSSYGPYHRSQPINSPNTFSFSADYTSVTRIRASRAGRKTVHSVNEQPHLYLGRPN